MEIGPITFDDNILGGEAVFSNTRIPIKTLFNSLDSGESSGLILNERVHFTSFPRSSYRWEVAPGTQRIEGFASASESVTLTTAPGGIYFLQHTVLGNPRDGVLHTALRQIGAPEGRALVARSYQRW